MGIALVLALLVFGVPRANAAPFTDNFDALIADMQSRAGALSNSTDKVQQKQYKSLVSALKTLNGKTSTSLATDIKNLGTVVKTLIKSFPSDFTPPGGSLLTNSETALDGLIDDVQTSINTTTTNFNALATSSCKTKTQTTVDTAQTQLDTASTTNITTAAKLLGTALKTELKADKAVTKCSSVITGGGGGGGGGGNGLGDFVSATISGTVNLNFKAVMGPDGIAAAGQYHPVNIITIEASYAPSAVLHQSMVLYVDNVTGPGTYPIDFDSQFDDEATQPQTSFLGAEGTITFTTADLANQKLVGTFAFTAPEVGSNTEMVTVTSGQFNISRMPAIPVKVPTNTNFMTATDNGFAFWGKCTGSFTTNAFDNILTIVGLNTFGARSISLILSNPTLTGVAYPVGNGSLYQDEKDGGTFYQGDPSGTVVFSTLDIASGIAEGTFTFSATQTIPLATNTVTVINGHFKNNNIITN